LHLLLWLYGPLLGLCRFFGLLILYTVGRTPWTGDQSVAKPQTTHGKTHIQKKSTQYIHPCLEFGFEPTISAFEQEKLVHP
jgi:hypothetical protein